ncbi:uncharacterized protein LOC110447026 [Mizuhopecten yessoensis]|uniref:uncharacterized protein LOC110447026 n=1 Tax=Mizuhopecten yessoensis TaxID=6573 RepID=UPI000B45F68C|nr:uncharacterized protein LOC110447026 [Mizuhopecten yessoensis]
MSRDSTTQSTSPGISLHPYMTTNIPSKPASPAGGEVLLCESETKTISCTLPFVINIIEAWYGRNDTATCNATGTSMMCHYDVKMTYTVMNNTCQDRSTCLLSAAPAIFGNSCVGKHAYLMVNYECVIKGSDVQQTPPVQQSFVASYTNINMSSEIIWRVHVPHAGLCGLRCKTDNKCLSFAFDPKQQICQGHRTSLLNEVKGQGHPENKMLYFELKWCGGGGFLFDVTGVCYAVYGVRHTPANCQKECSQHGSGDGKVVGGLLVLDTPEKLQNIWLKTRPDSWLEQENAFIVSGRKNGAGTWTFLDGAVIPDNMWAPGVLGTYSGDCVSVTRDGLVPTDCATTGFFICEKVLIKPKT